MRVAVPVENDCPVAEKVPERRRAAEPLEYDCPAADICDGARIMNDAEPVVVDEPLAVIVWKDGGGIVIAAEPAEVEEAAPVRALILSICAPPAEVDDPAAVICKPGLTASICRVPGDASKPEYPVAKYGVTVVIANNEATVAVFWIKNTPVPVADVSQKTVPADSRIRQ